MKTGNKILSFTLAMFINAGIVTACSQQVPNTPANNQSANTTVNSTQDSQGGSQAQINQTVAAAITSEQKTDAVDVQSEAQDDENTVKDSDMISSDNKDFSTSGFSTLAVKSDIKINTKINLAINKALNKAEKEQLLKDREQVAQKQLKLVEAKLKLLKDVDKAKLQKLKRKNVSVKASDVQTIKNDDGTTTKIIDIKFDGQNESRENKVINTFSSDGKLIRHEHYITVSMKDGYSRTYSRIADISADGSRKVIIKAETKWPNGRTRVRNEERNINADGSGTGTGTVVITTKDGKVTTYTINVSISVSGDVIVNPIPAPIPTATPIPSDLPSASPVASPSDIPSPSPTLIPAESASPTASPSV